MIKNNKISFLILFIIGLFAIVYGAGFHIADEILFGTFKGNYAFDGDVNFSNANVVGITSSNWGKNESNLYYMNGSVGIGTTTPQAKIHIQEINPLKALQVEGGVLGNVIAQFRRIDSTERIINIGAAGGEPYVSFIPSNTSWAIGTNSAGSLFKISSGASNLYSATAHLIINNVGNVGIGTTNPTESLSVKGSIAVNPGISSQTGTITFTHRIKSGTTDILAEITNYNTNTMVVAKVEWVNIYNWAGSDLSHGLRMASTRRINNNVDWIANNNQNLGETIVGSAQAPSIGWTDGVLTYTNQEHVAGIATITLTYTSASIKTYPSQ